MISLAFILGFIGAAIALLVGILIFSEVSGAMDCSKPHMSEHMSEITKACEKAKDMAWTVIGILPVALFFVLFTLFGGLDNDVEKPKKSHRERYMTRRERESLRKQKEIEDPTESFEKLDGYYKIKAPDRETHGVLYSLFEKLGLR